MNNWETLNYWRNITHVRRKWAIMSIREKYKWNYHVMVTILSSAKPFSYITSFKRQSRRSCAKVSTNHKSRRVFTIICTWYIWQFYTISIVSNLNGLYYLALYDFLFTTFKPLLIVNTYIYLIIYKLILWYCTDRKPTRKTVTKPNEKTQKTIFGFYQRNLVPVMGNIF